MLRNVVFSSLVLLLLPSVWAAAQSGWTRTQGGLFVKGDLSTVTAERYFNPMGEEVITNRFYQANIGAYAEYGLKERLTLIGQGFLLRANTYEVTRPVFGQGDLQLHLKYRFTNNRWPTAFSAGVDLPTGRANAFAQHKELPGVVINLPTGDGEFNFWFTLASSKSFGKFYATLFASYDLRTKYDGLPFRNLIQLGGELGYHPVDPLWLSFKPRMQFSEGESQYPQLGFIRGDGSTFSLYSFEAYYKPGDRWGYSIGMSMPAALPVKFHNVYAAPVLSLGIAFEK